MGGHGSLVRLFGWASVRVRSFVGLFAAAAAVAAALWGLPVTTPPIHFTLGFAYSSLGVPF